MKRLRAWRANRRWRRALVEIADRAEAEGWSAQEMLRANRAAYHLYKEVRLRREVRILNSGGPHETHDRTGADSRYIEVCWKCAEEYVAYLQAHPDEAPNHAVVLAMRPGPEGALGPVSPNPGDPQGSPPSTAPESRPRGGARGVRGASR